jgi:hypothetical protein
MVSRPRGCLGDEFSAVACRSTAEPNPLIFHGGGQVRKAVTGVNPVTSVGFSDADPLAGFHCLYALFRRRFASASLRSAVQISKSVILPSLRKVQSQPSLR